MSRNSHSVNERNLKFEYVRDVYDDPSFKKFNEDGAITLIDKLFSINSETHKDDITQMLDTFFNAYNQDS